MRRLLRWPLTRTGYAALAVVLAALVTVSVLAVHRFGTAPAGNRAAAAGPAGTTSGGDPASAGVGGSASARPSTSASASAGPSRAGAPPAGPGPGAPGAGWALMWNPQPARDGLGAF